MNVEFLSLCWSLCLFWSILWFCSIEHERIPCYLLGERILSITLNIELPKICIKTGKNEAGDFLKWWAYLLETYNTWAWDLKFMEFMRHIASLEMLNYWLQTTCSSTFPLLQILIIALRELLARQWSFLFLFSHLGDALCAWISSDSWTQGPVSEENRKGKDPLFCSAW